MKKIDKKPETLGKRFGQLFDYLIDRRSYLLRTGRNQRPEYHMRELLFKFMPYRGYQWTDRGAARFLWLNFVEIRQLIPGRETHTLERLENLWLAAKNFFINENQNKQTCKQLSAF